MQNPPPQQQNSTPGKKPDQKPDQKNDQSSNGKMAANVITGLVIGLIIGYGISWSWNHHQAAMMTEEMAANEMTAATTTPLVMSPSGISTSSAGSIVVADQPAGSNVFVSKAVFGDNGGWVSVQDDINGTPGRILGAAFFPSGSTAGNVPLIRATVAGQTYFAVLRDNIGMPHLFNMQMDMPLTDSSGNMVMATFNAR